MDKWSHYFDVYHRHFERFRGTGATLVEIGVFNGGSLGMWREYLGKGSTVVGVDINPECARYAEPGIDIVVGDQANRDFLRDLAARYSDISILIDDGGHHMHQQIATFEELYPRLRADGVYLCEDTHTSYHEHFGGGLRRDGTFVELSKSLVDRLNAWQIPQVGMAPDVFTRSTNSIHFYTSVIVIERQPRSAPQEKTYGSQADLRYIAPSLAGR